jgi:hypothetical protein
LGVVAEECGMEGIEEAVEGLFRGKKGGWSISFKEFV